MNSYITSYNGLFTHNSPDTPIIDRVEIPLIQRDYAQGRDGGTVERIRNGFLDVLHNAVTGGERVSLDFIFGEVQNGTLRPLDGQQRLTTLFLLHWYLASRADRLGQEQGWKHLGYATRASARLFCERIVKCRPPDATECPSLWIEDQPWYLYTWRHDPTIQSMLVMLDAIHHRFRGDDCVAAWERLVDLRSPAITFHVLPMEQMGLDDDLYIKMNSRGKPLTPFENFKARLEQTLEVSCPERVRDFALKVDGAWSNLLWPYHGGDFIVDDEFLRYFHFVTEVCEWRAGRLVTGNVASLADLVFGPQNPKAAEQLEFLFRAFDTWEHVNIAQVFEDVLALVPSRLESGDTTKVVIFGQQDNQEVNLFHDCCRNYGDTRGRNRVFSLPNTLLLYAVLLHRLHESHDFARRLRVLRNLIEASSNELRLERMPALIADVARIVVDGVLDGVTAFNQAQVADERLKAEVLARNPSMEHLLFQLEDHPALRGCLAAFDIAAADFGRRATAFHTLLGGDHGWSSVTGALLAIGDYSRQLNDRLFQLGSASNLAPWRDLLTGAARSELERTRVVLGRLLDEVAQTEGDQRGNLDAIEARWLDTCEKSSMFGWRYYFVKYEPMRQGRSGIYAGSNKALGYEICMLDKRQMNSWYRDPYLLAIHLESGVAGAVEDPWFTGYETQVRWMRLRRSGIGLRCIEAGIELQCTSVIYADDVSRVCEQHNVQPVGDSRLLQVPQVQVDGSIVDVRDRVQLGAALLRDLVAAGL